MAGATRRDVHARNTCTCMDSDRLRPGIASADSSSGSRSGSAGPETAHAGKLQELAELDYGPPVRPSINSYRQLVTARLWHILLFIKQLCVLINVLKGFCRSMGVGCSQSLAFRGRGRSKDDMQEVVDHVHYAIALQGMWRLLAGKSRLVNSIGAKFLQPLGLNIHAYTEHNWCVVWCGLWYTSGN